MSDAADHLETSRLCTALAEEIGKRIQASLKENGMVGTVGFALFVFEVKTEDEPAMAFVSNALKGDVCATLDELRAKLEHMRTPTTGAGGAN